MAAEFPLRTRLTAYDAATGKMRAFGRSVEGLGQRFRKVGKGLSIGVTAPITGLGVGILGATVRFESGMNRVKALTGTSGEALEALREQAQDLGRTTAFSASQAAEGMSFLAQAGFDSDKILGAMPATLDLASAAQLDLARSADIVSNVMTGYGLTAEQTGLASDVLSKAFTSSNTDLVQLGEAFKMVGPVGKEFGLSIEETAALLGTLGDSGIQASLGGTTLRGALVRLADPSAEAARRLGELGLRSGDVFDDEGRFVDFTGFLEDLGESGAKAGDIMAIFGQRAGPGVLALLGKGTPAIREFTRELEGAAGWAGQVADTQLEGLPGDLALLRSATEGLALAISEAGLIQETTKLVKGITRFVSKMSEANPELLKWGTYAAAAAAAAGPLLMGFGAIATGAGAVFKGLAWARQGLAWVSRGARGVGPASKIAIGGARGGLAGMALQSVFFADKAKALVGRLTGGRGLVFALKSLGKAASGVGLAMLAVDTVKFLDRNSDAINQWFRDQNPKVQSFLSTTGLGDVFETLGRKGGDAILSVPLLKEIAPFFGVQGSERVAQVARAQAPGGAGNAKVEIEVKSPTNLPVSANIARSRDVDVDLSQGPVLGTVG